VGGYSTDAGLGIAEGVEGKERGCGGGGGHGLIVNCFVVKVSVGAGYQGVWQGGYPPGGGGTVASG